MKANLRTAVFYNARGETAITPPSRLDLRARVRDPARMLRPGIGLLAALVFGSACTSTTTVSPAALVPLKAPGQAEALVLNTPKGRVRVDPNTRLRFALVDGRKTPWLRARSLRTNDLGVFVERNQREVGWAWEEIQEAEIQNISGAKTFALIVGSAAVVATVVAIAAASKGKCCGGLAAGTAHTSARIARGSVILAAHGGGIGPPMRPHGANPDITSEPEGAEPAAGHLFAGASRRRSIVQLVPSTQGFLPPLSPSQFEQSVAFSVRLRDIWEMGGVVRAASLLGPSGQSSLRFIGAARGGLHLELDANRRFAIPLLLDMGGGPGVPLQARLNLGLRIRATDSMSIGLYAPSPTLTRVREAGETFSRWSFPAGLELSFAL